MGTGGGRFTTGSSRNFGRRGREAMKSGVDFGLIGAAGHLELERARVRWFLSIDRADLPGLPEEPAENGSTHRAIAVDGEAFALSDGFADLHSESYRQILAGRA